MARCSCGRFAGAGAECNMCADSRQTREALVERDARVVERTSVVRTLKRELNCQETELAALRLELLRYRNSWWSRVKRWMRGE